MQSADLLRQRSVFSTLFILLCRYYSCQKAQQSQQPANSCWPWSMTTTSGRLLSTCCIVSTGLSHQISMFPSSLCLTSSGTSSYHRFAHLTPLFLHNSQYTLNSILSCLRLYSFWASPLQPLAKCHTVSLASPHTLHIALISWFSNWCCLNLVFKACSCNCK